MALFRFRTVAGVICAASVGHLAMYLVPDSLHAYNLTQTALALLAISSLMVMIMMKHRGEDNLLLQTQEEFLLVCAFGLAWFAICVAFRAIRQSSGYPCSVDDMYCFMED